MIVWRGGSGGARTCSEAPLLDALASCSGDAEVCARRHPSLPARRRHRLGLLTAIATGTPLYKPAMSLATRPPEHHLRSGHVLRTMIAASQTSLAVQFPLSTGNEGTVFALGASLPLQTRLHAKVTSFLMAMVVRSSSLDYDCLCQDRLAPFWEHVCWGRW